MTIKYIVEARTKKDNFLRYELPAMDLEELENNKMYNELKNNNEYNLILKTIYFDVFGNILNKGF